MLAYNYIALYLISRKAQHREMLGWKAMFLVATSIFCLLYAWSLEEPLAEEFLPAFIVLSLIVGIFFRQSALSPYKLAEFWIKLFSKRRDKKD